MVGLFFYIDSDELDYHNWIYHVTSEEKAEKYGDFLIDPAGHDKLFDQAFKNVPDHIEYFDFPRGRVVFDTKSESHIIYIDKCLADEADHIAKSFFIKKYTVDTDDEHYVCPGCIPDDFF